MNILEATHLNLCPQCQSPLTAESYFCTNCDSQVSDQFENNETRGLSLIYAAEFLSDEEREVLSVDPSQEFLLLQFDGYFHSKIVTLPPGKTIILGRKFASSSYVYDEWIDLSEYDAYLKGVSREHVLLRRSRNRLYIIDLGSRNGTFIHGKRLLAFEPYEIAGNDEFQLGSMTIRLTLETCQFMTG